MITLSTVTQQCAVVNYIVKHTWVKKGIFSWSDIPYITLSSVTEQHAIVYHMVRQAWPKKEILPGSYISFHAKVIQVDYHCRASQCEWSCVWLKSRVHSVLVCEGCICEVHYKEPRGFSPCVKQLTHVDTYGLSFILHDCLTSPYKGFQLHHEIFLARSKKHHVTWNFNEILVWMQMMVPHTQPSNKAERQAHICRGVLETSRSIISGAVRVSPQGLCGVSL